MFLAERRARSSKDGMSYGNPIDFEGQKIQKTVLSTSVAELYSFGSCQFLRGLWMDISGEVADILLRTDAKNLVKTARTNHLLEEKETIHMFPFCERKPVQEVFMILLTFQLRIVWQIA